jgi:hypothetical protein
VRLSLLSRDRVLTRNAESREAGNEVKNLTEVVCNLSNTHIEYSYGSILRHYFFSQLVKGVFPIHFDAAPMTNPVYVQVQCASVYPRTLIEL